MSIPGKPPSGSNGNGNANGNGEDEPLRRRAWHPPAPAPSPPSSRARPVPGTPMQPATPPGTPAGERATSNARRVPPAPVQQHPESRPKARSGATTATRRDANPNTRLDTRSDTRPSRGFFHLPQGRPWHRTALISRGERTLFWALLTAVLAMSVFLVRYRNRVNAHFQERALAIPLATAASGSSPAPLLLYLANDETGALAERPIAFPLPEDPNTRARVVLEKLLSEYTAPGSPHPLKALRPGIEGVDEVFLAPAPGRRAGQLAVVDLTPSFIHAHPSGIEPETLTLLSMIATLHANLPSITQVRFLVDGEPRPTLAGHADLSRTYLAGSAQMAPSEAFTTKAARP